MCLRFTRQEVLLCDVDARSYLTTTRRVATPGNLEEKL